MEVAEGLSIEDPTPRLLETVYNKAHNPLDVAVLLLGNHCKGHPWASQLRPGY